MPYLVHVVAAWIAGLLLGQFAAPRSLVVWLLLAALGSMLARPRGVVRRPTVWCALLAAGALVGQAAFQRAEWCKRTLQRELARGAALQLIADVAPADVAPAGVAATRGLLEASGGASPTRCVVPVSVRWQGAAPPDGHAVHVRATAQITARGLALRGATVVRVGSRHPLRATRAWAARTIDRLFRTRAALVRALLIADQDGIPRDLRDRYADAGLVHMLSVSGMHVAIIASALLTLASGLRIPRHAADPLAMAGVTLYVLMLGCPPPAVRSAVMLVVMALSRRWQRPMHDWAPLALGAVVPTVNPLVVVDLGWQLSVGGMAALVAARSLRRSLRAWAAERAQATRPWYAHALPWLATQRGVVGWLAGEVFTGLVATLVTAPLIAWSFGRVSVVAPLSNLAAGPIIALLQPALFLALLLSPVPALSRLVADATQPLMALLDTVADASARLPMAVLPVSASLLTIGAAGLASALLVRGTAARRRAPWAVAALASLTSAVWVPLLYPGSGALELHLIDVGQGDAVALRTPHGRWILMDAGPSGRGTDAGLRAVIPHLRRRGGQVALMVLSHAHEDHVGGAASVLRAFRPAWWWEPAFVTTSPGYAAALQELQRQRIRWRRVRPGDQWTLDGVELTVLAPDSAWTAAQENANETSVVLRVGYGRHRFLLTGDAERDEEAWLLAHHGADALAADVLKVGHHGSRTSTTRPFLEAVAPRVGVASVGAGNRYGHPAPETLAALVARDVPLFRTDLDGTIIVRSDGRTLWVTYGDEEWRVPDRATARASDGGPV